MNWNEKIDVNDLEGMTVKDITVILALATVGTYVIIWKSGKAIEKGVIKLSEFVQKKYKEHKNKALT